ncbi:hypothetical protein A4G99_19170 [Haladaptatus sp. R4]|nr:hypothetical protein A4G99_19170 [Haladaptatus sp. R4]
MFPSEELPPISAGTEVLEDKRFKWKWLRKIGVKRAKREAPNAKYDTEILPRLRSSYYGMLRMIDDQVRRFVEFLETENLREDTLIVFLSDHGDFAGDYGLMRKGVDLPEATVRIPLIFNGPGVEADRSPSTAHVSIVDIMPTLCDVAGGDHPPGTQGRSLWTLLSGTDVECSRFNSVYVESGWGGRHSSADDVPSLDEARKNELNPHTQSGRIGMIRRDKWKFVFDMEDGPELYNLVEDPAEKKDLSADPAHDTLLQELYADFSTWSLYARDTLPEKRSIQKVDPSAKRH